MEVLPFSLARNVAEVRKVGREGWKDFRLARAHLSKTLIMTKTLGAVFKYLNAQMVSLWKKKSVRGALMF